MRPVFFLIDIISFPVSGEAPVLFLYTLKKFSMDIVDFSFFSTYSVLMGVVGNYYSIKYYTNNYTNRNTLIIAKLDIVRYSFKIKKKIKTENQLFRTGYYLHRK